MCQRRQNAAIDERQVGPLEIGREIKAQQLRATPCDVGISREIEIDLHAEGENADERAERARLSDRVVEIAVGEYREIVGKDQLLDQPLEDLRDGPSGFLARWASALVDLGEEILRPDDRSGDEMGKEGQEERKSRQASCRRHVAAIDVDIIGNPLEGIEADADRQNEVEKQLVGTEGKDGGEAREEKIDVFEDTERPEIAGDGHRKRQPPPVAGRAIDDDARQEVEQRRTGEKKDESDVPKAVEDKSRDGQSDDGGPPRQGKIPDRDDQKEKPVGQRREQHAGPILPAWRQGQR